MAGYRIGLWGRPNWIARDNFTLIGDGWRLIDVDGNILPLTANNVYVSGTSGTGLPDPENITTRYGTIDGGSWQRRIFAPRQFSLQCYFAPCGTLEDLHILRQKAIDYLSINQATPIQVAYQLNDQSLYIDAYYNSGLNMGDRAGFSEKIQMTFLAPNPLWYESIINSQVLSSSGAVAMSYVQQNESAMSGGLGNKVRAIIKKSTNYYAFGDFTNYAKKSSGGAWSAIADSPRTAILDAVKDGTDIYAVGTAKCIEKLSNAESLWDVVPTANTNGTVYAVVKDSSNNIYIGGNFTNVGGVTVSNIAKWNGLTWSSMSGGVNGIVYGLFADGTDIYLAGAFTGVVSGADYIAKWNGTVYSVVGSSSALNGTARCIVKNGSDFYVGGDFTTPTGKLAVYTGGAWSANFLCSQSVTGLATSALGVIAVSPTGTFTYIASAATRNSPKVAKVTGAYDATIEDNALTPYSVYADATNIYVGHSTGLKKWTASAYSTLATTTDIVHSITVNGSDIYFGGAFTHATCDRILRYNGGSLYAVGTDGDINGTVYGLLYYSGINLVGAFTAVGGSSISRVACYNSSRWYSLVYTSATTMKAIVISSGYAYIGGDFGVYQVALATGLTTELAGLTNVNCLNYLTNLYAGGTFTERVKKWDGAAWVSVDSGTNGEVYKLANDGSTLYMVGNFTAAGGEVACGGIARLVGGVWVNFGTGANVASYAVRAIQVSSPTEIYVGGNFPSFNGVTLTFPVAKYDGSAWVEAFDFYESADADILSMLIEKTLAVNTFGYNAVANVTFFGDIITYEGTAPAAPQVVFTGTGTITSLRNTTTEGDIYFDSLTLVAGDVATLELSPESLAFNKVNYGLTTTKLLGKITTASTISKFRLQAGDNSVRVIAASTITATIKWRNYHWSIDGVV